MTPPLADALRAAKVYDLEQPRFFGMPVYPSHKPGYFYALHRRHRDTYQPAAHGPRSGASGTLTMMEHSGTHIDALCHQACDLKLYVYTHCPLASVSRTSLSRRDSKYVSRATPPTLRSSTYSSTRSPGSGSPGRTSHAPWNGCPGGNGL